MRGSFAKFIIDRALLWSIMILGFAALTAQIVSAMSPPSG
jgi:hypothetical protein